MAQEFHDDRYRDAHEAYIQWLRDNPRGCVLNRLTGTFGRLHQYPCMHIADYSDPSVSLTRKPKIYDTPRAAVEQWAKERGVEWTPRGTCLE
jgi:hypothetical protein